MPRRLCPDTRVVSIGDREADIYDLFELALSRDDHPALLVRARADRSVTNEGSIERLWALVEKSELGTEVREVSVPRTAKRTPREARLSVRFSQVELHPPRTGPGGRRCLLVWAVLAREEHPPQGAEPLEWMLLTTVEVRTFAEGWRSSTGTSGAGASRSTTTRSRAVASSRSGSSQLSLDCTTCLAVDMIVAWRILYMTRLGRGVPALPATAVFTDDEWQSLYRVTHPTKPIPEKPPSLAEMIGMIAKLGGHVGRKSDAPPGVESVWVGLTRLFDISMCWRLFGPAPNTARAP